MKKIFLFAGILLCFPLSVAADYSTQETKRSTSEVDRSTLEVSRNVSSIEVARETEVSTPEVTRENVQEVYDSFINSAADSTSFQEPKNLSKSGSELSFLLLGFLLFSVGMVLFFRKPGYKFLDLK